MLNRTHDARRKSWVTSAEGHANFPLQNLPLGCFSPKGETKPRGGIAIGDCIFDIGAALAVDLFGQNSNQDLDHDIGRDLASAATLAAGPRLNDFLALGEGARVALRARVMDLLDADMADAALRARVGAVLYAAADCVLHRPLDIPNYTDFFAGIHHATHAGRLFRPDNPLLPNYRHLPIGYHGRASSVTVSGGGFPRPRGQIKPSAEAPPVFTASDKLDFELELGIIIGPGNEAGTAIQIADAPTHIAGYCLLNDWSARDIQAWEYQPLGPFLAKNFKTQISPWIVAPEAMRPFRVAHAARAADDPPLLSYLDGAEDRAAGALDVTLDVAIVSARMREAGLPPQRITHVSACELYWTPAQLIAHHTCNGCNLEAGDLIGTGTISGDEPGTYGSLLEITAGGREPFTLASGETRRFLEDGDEIVISAQARRDGFVSIGFGECRGRVAPARAADGRKDLR
jgi:fumarylacetoacetase